MISFLFFTLILFSAALAAALLSYAATSRFVEPVTAYFKRKRTSILTMADLAGLEPKPRTVLFLTFVHPIAFVLMNVTYKQKLVKADKQLPDALALLGNALKAGLSLPQAIEMASIEMDKPLGSELKRVASQLKLGSTVEDALAILAERLPTDDVALVVQSIQILRRTGGNLIETFSTLASTVDGRLKVEDRIRVLTAQGIYQGILLLSMPWVLGFILSYIAPDYIDPLINTRLGHVFIGVGIFLEAAGAIWLKKIVMIKV